MIDIENMIKALRRRKYMEDLLNVTFKRCRRTFYFWMQLYDKRSFRNINFFYRELLQWWSEFRDLFADERDLLTIISNSKNKQKGGFL